jgi:hypothetical protein
MKKLILIICLFSITVIQSFAQRGPIVFHWHGRYLQDAQGRRHCLNGGKGICIGRNEMATDNKSQNLNALSGVNEGILEYDAAKNKWYIYISNDVLVNAETKANFSKINITGFDAIVVAEDALAKIDQKFKGKRLTAKLLSYTKDDAVASLGNERKMETKNYLKIELKDCIISN